MTADKVTMGRSEDAWITTGSAARLCSVSPDTVQKWIRKGKLSAQRTAGNHYRIARAEIEPFMTSTAQARWFSAPPEHCRPQPLRCWEYLGRQGEVRDECLKCVVYRVRASWCFEVLGQTPGAEHARQFCKTQASCVECAYYRQVCSLPSRVLIVGAEAAMRAMLGDSEEEELSIEFAGGGYQASTMLGFFRPAFVIVDEELAKPGRSDLLECLAHETRIPGLKVIIAVSRDAAPLHPGSGNAFDGLIEKPFNRKDLAALLARIPVERVTRNR